MPLVVVKADLCSFSPPSQCLHSPLTRLALDMDQPNNYDAVRTAHASMGIVAWVVFFPCGSALMRLLSSPRSWLVHALTQIFAYAMYTAVVGMGIWMTMNSDNVS